MNYVKYKILWQDDNLFKVAGKKQKIMSEICLVSTTVIQE